MVEEAGILQRCVAMVRLLDREGGWGLGPTEAADLAAHAAAHAGPQHTDAQIRAMIANLQRDRPAVEALRHPASPAHQRQWAQWMSQARAILRRANLHWAKDDAVDFDDLAQIALLELARSLPTFRYQSRFSTWAYQVIASGVRRHLRDMSAQKRSAEIDRSVDPASLELVVGAGDQPDAQVRAQMLNAEVYRELCATLGQRNAEVFRLWACHDLSAEMIGQRVGLSAARVYALLTQARQHLRGSDTIGAWGDGPGEP